MPKLRAFQRLFGLTADGVVGAGPTTWWGKTFSPAYPGTTTLREGQHRQNVRLVQFWPEDRPHRVTRCALESVTVDGKFGAGTAAAVRRFQRYFGLTADGVVGRTTWQKLYEVYNDIANRLR